MTTTSHPAARTAPGPAATRLLASSARHSYDPEVDLDWEAPLVEGMWAMQPERMSLYGTELWESLTHEQRLELSRHEVGAIASTGLWFEIILMRMMLRDLYHDDPRAARTQFALTEVGDETRHSVMFGRAIERLGVPAYGPPEQVHRIAPLFQLLAHGPSAYSSILVAEETLDRWQREAMNDERLQPMMRMVCRIHVLEEARHVTFAREEVMREAPGLSRAERVWHQTLVAQVAFLVMRSMVNPKVYAAVGLDPREARRAALSNPHYQATVAWMGEKVMAFLQEQGMVGRHTLRTWRRALLLPQEGPSAAER